MKRSEVNRYIKDAADFMRELHFLLPPFAYWSKEEWEKKGAECDAIRDTMLGWDVTDFGSGDFEKTGLLLFTLRNGSLTDPRYKKVFAEKIMVVREEQVTPMHFHWKKTEDIINRGGGNLLIKLYNSTENEELADTEISVMKDGEMLTLPAGSIVRLTPGESITLTSGLYHTFYAEKGKGKVLAGEVSMTNDDNVDNRFLEKTGRFPAITEDEAPLHLLANEYPKAE